MERDTRAAEASRDNKRQTAAKRRARQRAEAGKTVMRQWQSFKQGVVGVLRLSALKNPAFLKWATRALVVIALCSVTANVLLYSRYSSSRPVLRIGKTMISKADFQMALEGTAGKEVLTKMVFSELVRKAATQAGLMPSIAEVTARITNMQKQGTPGVTQDDPAVRNAVALGIAMENLRMRGLTASDAEIAAYYAQHQKEFAEPSQIQTTLVLTSSSADAAQATRSLTNGLSPDAIAALPRMRVAGIHGVTFNIGVLPPAIGRSIVQTVASMHDGDVKTFQIQNTFLTFKLLGRTGGTIPTLADIKDEVARLVKLQKAPSEAVEMAELYKANPPSFDVDRYADYFSDIKAVDTGTPKNGAKANPKTASVP